MRRRPGRDAVLAAAQRVLDQAGQADPPVVPGLPEPGRAGHIHPGQARIRGEALLLVAARAGTTRLIDNMPLVLGTETAMLLAIDVGNTNTVLGVFDGDEVVEHWRIATDPARTADEIAVVLQGLLGAERHAQGPGHQRHRAVLHRAVGTARDAGDVPPLLRRRARADRGARGADRACSVRMDNPKEVGSDRIMNAVAAVHLYGGPALVVDFGTSTNFDAVSARGEFIGGALAPGIEISVDALSRRAAQLLKVELARPHHVIGKNTVEALQSGIIYGFAGQVEGHRPAISRELAPDDPDSVTVIATGGLAPLVLDEVSVIDAYEPWLTLIGLRLVFERNTADLRPSAGLHPRRKPVRIAASRR